MEKVEGYFYVSWSGRIYYVSRRGFRYTVYDIESHVAVELLSKRRLSVDDVAKVAAYIELYSVDRLEEKLQQKLGRDIEVLRVYQYEPRWKRKKVEVSEEAR